MQIMEMDEKDIVEAPFFGMESERLLRCKAYFKCDYDYPGYNLKGKMFPVTALHFFEGAELTSISIDTEEYGEIQDMPLARDKIVICRSTEYSDSKGNRVYENDIVQIGDLCYMVKWNFAQWNLYCTKRHIWSSPYFYSFIRDSVKRGNLLINPELLGAE